MGFAICCGLAVLPVWIVEYPPMVDLAQHAAQVSTGLRWDSGAFPYSDYFWINWRTPYVLTRFLATGLAQWMPVANAFQVLISLAVVGIPLATLGLVREAGGRPVWALMAVPAGYSISFYMGFVAFIVGSALALVFVRLAWRYSGTPTLGRAWLLLALSQVIFLTHPLAFGWAGLVAALLVAARAGGWRQTIVRWWPLLAALVLPIAWILSTALLDDHVEVSLPRANYSWTRLPHLAALVVGLPINELSLALSLMVLIAPWLAGAQLARRFARWIPCLVALALFFGMPSAILSSGYLHQRFAAFVLPTLLFALDPKPQASRRRWLRTCIFLSPTALWLALIHVQFLGARAETGAFGDLLDVMEPGKKVLYLPVEPKGSYLPYPSYLHFGSWYQVERGGLVEFSFAGNFPNRFRYLPEREPALPHGFEFRPWTFDWQANDGARWDYFLVRSSRDPARLFLKARAPVVPVEKATGGWWLYARADGSAGR